MDLEALEDLGMAIWELCEQNPQACQIPAYILAQAGCYGLNRDLPSPKKIYVGVLTPSY